MAKRVKYPRTLHLPYSQGITNDDKVLKYTSHFNGKRVIVTEKMDGENSTLYRDYYHARSIDSKHHESRSWLKSFHSGICRMIPPSARICGENMFAKHSIQYNNLDSYFLGFSWWEDTKCISWDDTVHNFSQLGITPVKVLYDGVYDENKIKALFKEDENMEGFVVRLAESFSREDFSKSVAKFVRENHVQTDEHWMSQKVVPNKLKS